MIYSEQCPVCDNLAVVIPSAHGAERICSHSARTAIEAAVRTALSEGREPALAGARS